MTLPRCPPVRNTINISVFENKMSYIRWLSIFILLTISTTAYAHELLNCSKQDDMLIKTVCMKSDIKLKASAELIAAILIPEQPVLPWLRSIAGNCNADKDCIGRALLLEWLKYEAKASDLSHEQTINRAEVCQAFQAQLKNELIPDKRQSLSQPIRATSFR